MQVCDHYNNFSTCGEKENVLTTGNADMMKARYGTWREKDSKCDPENRGLCHCYFLRISQWYNNYLTFLTSQCPFFKLSGLT